MNPESGELKLELLLELGTMLGKEVELDYLLETVGKRVANAMNADRATLWLVDAKSGGLRSRVADLPELDELRLQAGCGLAGQVVRTGQTLRVPDVRKTAAWNPAVDKRTGYTTRSALCAPICDPQKRVVGAVQVLNPFAGRFDQRDEDFLLTLGKQIGLALSYTSLRTNRESNGVDLCGPINHIVGTSKAMAEVYSLLLRVAPTDAGVLLRGETGTGKGLFARAFHVNSRVSEGPMVHVDCTNLPDTLIESELFGHERGAFTGAHEQVKGKVELASGGTLFLDEVGELPLRLQGKLLRFLQDRSFERVGGSQTLHSQARVIAATNCDLKEMVAQRTFRQDLYYRLHVVDIELPPLRKRGPGDILSLANYFLGHFAKRYGKLVPKVSPQLASQLQSRSWLGNVRELEHAMERAIVLWDESELYLDFIPLDPFDTPQGARPQEASENQICKPLTPDLTLRELNHRYAQECLARNGGNRSATARGLGISRNRLARLLVKEESVRK